MAEKPAPGTAEAELAKSKEQHAAILAEHKAREKWMPTPTQEENDQAALGNPQLEKKPDGSPVEERQLEGAKKPGGYTTRAATAG